MESIQDNGVLQPESEKKVLYLSGEQMPSPHSFLALWCLNRLGKIEAPSENDIVIPSTSPSSMSILQEHTVLPKFDSKEGRESLQNLANNVLTKSDLSSRERHVLKRIVSYMGFCFTDQKYLPKETLTRMGHKTLFYDLLTTVSTVNTEDLPRAIVGGVGLIDQVIKRGIDPFKMSSNYFEKKLVDHVSIPLKDNLQKLDSRYQSLIDKASTGKKVSMLLKILGEEGIEDLVIENFSGSLEILKGEKIGIAIVGPPNSGKSTLVANLVHEMKEVVKDLGYDGELKCNGVDFDVSTPDVGIISEGNGFEGFKKEDKLPWSTKIAAETVEKYLSDTKGNINIISMPGGRPDEITEILSMPLDSVILLVAAENDVKWIDKRKLWKDALKKCGVEAPILIRSRLKGEISRVTGDVVEESTITSIHWRKDLGEGKNWTRRIGARVVGLNRKMKKEEFFKNLATLILLDIAPQIVLRSIEHQRLELRNLLKQNN